jgi:hypothetical protein
MVHGAESDGSCSAAASKVRSSPSWHRWLLCTSLTSAVLPPNFPFEMAAAAALILAAFPTLASAGASALNNPCIDATTPQSKQPWCNASLDIDTRVEDMLKRMTIEEKIPLLNTAPRDPIKSLGLNPYNWWEEASSGVSNGHQTTKFAYPITTGMSFNRTLWQLTGRQIAHEARALMNAGQAGSTYWAPVINLAREVSAPALSPSLPGVKPARLPACNTPYTLMG